LHNNQDHPIVNLFGAMPAILAMTCQIRTFAPPPLVTGDVPTADKGTFEWYLGALRDADGASKQELFLPYSELVYGLSSRQEINFVVAGLHADHEYGVNDAVIGTKFVFLQETARRPGIAGSFELKLPTGNESRGLGSGEFDYNLLLRSQKTWGPFTAIVNGGYTFVTPPPSGGEPDMTENVWLLSFAQGWQLAKRTQLLSEIYFESRGERGEPDRVAANLGFSHELSENLVFHSAIGRSLRQDARGGPDLRAYAGIKWDFDAPWRKKSEISKKTE
jgi:hypothetical protein